MVAAEAISNLDQLGKFANKDNIIEILIRGKHKRIAEFHKIALSNTKGDETKELLQKVLDVANKNNSIASENTKFLKDFAKKNTKRLERLTCLTQVNTVLGALNLCATIAGFAIMYVELEKISGQIDHVMATVKEGQDISSNYEFKKICSEYRNMLDCRKKQKYYTEEQMRLLVDSEYNVLELLLDGLMKNHTDDVDNLIVSIYSLAAMMTESLRHFDEVYYLNNKEAIGDGYTWHSSHDTWVALLDKLLSDEVVEKLQDHAIFDFGLSTTQTDAYYRALCDQVRDMKESIEDNQVLVQEFESEELMTAFETYVNQEALTAIEDAFEHTAEAKDNPEAVAVYQDTMKKMALAV